METNLHLQLLFSTLETEFKTVNIPSQIKKFCYVYYLYKDYSWGDFKS